MGESRLEFDFLQPTSESDELGSLGHFRVHRLMGRGGMGFVFEATDSRLRRRIALKVMNPQVASSRRSRQRFLEEARSMAAIRHDNVATIFEVGQQGNVPFIAMEILVGAPLDRWHQQVANPTIDAVVRIGMETCLGLSAAHQAGIVHRDIKPANIWIEEPSGRVKILDFGLAVEGTTGDRWSGLGCVVGTPGYLAPEQARSEPVDDRTDLYSLGVVLFELIAGELPLFHRSVPLQLIAIVARSPRPLLEVAPETPPSVAEVIDRLLAKEAYDRPCSATAAHDQLGDALRRGSDEIRKFVTSVREPEKSKPSVTRSEKPAATRTSILRFGQRRPGLWWGVGVATLLVMVGGALTIFYRDSVRSAGDTNSASTRKAGAGQGGDANPGNGPAGNVSAGNGGEQRPISVASLSPLALTEARAVAPRVVRGRPARFRLQLINEAIAEEDPRRLHSRARVVAQIRTFITRQSGRRRPAAVFPRRFAPAQLPRPGAATDVEIVLGTSELPLGSYSVEFVLQSPAGAKLAATGATVRIEEDFESGELVGFEFLRISPASGRDGFARRGNPGGSGVGKTVEVQTSASGRESVGVLEFDFPPGDASARELDAVVLALTLQPGSPRVSNAVLAAYATLKPPRWQESDGKSSPRFEDFEISEDAERWQRVARTTVDNSGGRLEKRGDGVRFYGAGLRDYLTRVAPALRASRERLQITIVAETVTSKPFRFSAHESGVGRNAAALAIRRK